MTSYGSNGVRATVVVSMAIGALLLVCGASASAASPKWRVDSLANTAAQPGAKVHYGVQIANVGDAPAPAVAGGNSENCVPGAVAPADPSKCYSVQISLPPGLKGLAAGPDPLSGGPGWKCSGNGPGAAPKIIGATILTCSNPGDLSNRQVLSHAGFSFRILRFTAEVGPATAGTQTAAVEVSGGGAPAASTVDPTQISEATPDFGIDAFDAPISNADGSVSTKAAGHPDSGSTFMDFNTVTNANPVLGELSPVQPVKDVSVELPPGLIGNPARMPQCSQADLANAEGPEPKPLCLPGTQLGSALVRFNNIIGASVLGPLPVFNLIPPPGAPAQFGMNVAGTVVNFTPSLRSSSDFGITIDSRNIPEGLGTAGSSVTLWGNPTSESHRLERACAGQANPWRGGSTCPSEAAEEFAFLRNPTACTAPGNGLSTSLHIDSWVEPGALDAEGSPDLSDPNWQSRTVESHEQPGFPLPSGPSALPEGYVGPVNWGPQAGIEECGGVAFEPSLSVHPTTEQADSPSGLELDLEIPQECWQPGEEGSVCQSDLKKAVVALPEGLRVNPSAASGLGGCSSSQIGLLGTEFEAKFPIHFTDAPARCPKSSKIGKLRIETPLLSHPIDGSVYLATQEDNPFGSLLAMYLVAEDPESGTIIKLPGEVSADPSTGDLVATVDHNPQLPFERLHLELFSGPRAALRTPPACGSYTTHAVLTPWAHDDSENNGGAPIAHLESTFQISNGPLGGPCPPEPAAFLPRLAAGSANPVAGIFSPFNLQLTRDDGTQEFGGVSATLPEGLLAKLSGIPYCPDSALAAVSSKEGTGQAQISAPSCPAASQIGTVTVGAGAGSNPFYTDKGRAYLAGPYKGAPLSVAVVAPAVAGPFDLGSVVVRNALRVNSETTRATAVSDPFPTILHGIPLDLRNVRVELNRPSFTLNPTSCDPMMIESTITSSGGAVAAPSERFQVSGCESLAFKPKLALRFTGKTKRTGNPALHATLTMPAGGANIARARVTLPKGLLIDNAHINNPCTRVQFNEGACPPTSILGSARAFSPLLDNPLEGPVYFRSNGGERELPDLVADLNGQLHVVVVGFIDAKQERIRNTFAAVPDAPVSKFTLNLFGGKKGLIENGHDLCRNRPKALAQFDGQNGKIHDVEPMIKVRCHGGKSKRKHRARQR